MPVRTAGRRVTRGRDRATAVRLLGRPAARTGGIPAASDQDPPALRAAVQEPDLHLLRSRDAGLRELVTIGKVWELAQLDRKVKKGAKYDLVIVDAPQPSRPRLLRTPKTFGDIGARRADQASGGHDLRLHHRPRPHRRPCRRVARGDAGQRDARSSAQADGRARHESRPESSSTGSTPSCSVTRRQRCCASGTRWKPLRTAAMEATPSGGRR